VGQSFGFASELPLGPELALLPLNYRKFLAILQGRFEKHAVLGENACPTIMWVAGLAWRYNNLSGSEPPVPRSTASGGSS